MLVEAASWRPAPRKLSVSEAVANLSLARYVEGWGREGDRGLIAEVDGAAVGASWWRFFSQRDHGYGFIEPAIPELSIAVVEEMRGRGVGTALLEALINQARLDRVPALSLSVEVDNAALRLYDRLGFTRVACVDDAWTMRRDTSGAYVGG
jgi:ribosomal protein S18 acetylase RimI-like enzyme